MRVGLGTRGRLSELCWLTTFSFLFLIGGSRNVLFGHLILSLQGCGSYTALKFMTIDSVSTAAVLEITCIILITAGGYFHRWNLRYSKQQNISAEYTYYITHNNYLSFQAHSSHTSCIPSMALRRFVSIVGLL